MYHHSSYIITVIHLKHRNANHVYLLRVNGIYIFASLQSITREPLPKQLDFHKKKAIALQLLMETH